MLTSSLLSSGPGCLRVSRALRPPPFFRSGFFLDPVLLPALLFLAAAASPNSRRALSAADSCSYTASSRSPCGNSDRLGPSTILSSECGPCKETRGTSRSEARRCASSDLPLMGAPCSRMRSGCSARAWTNSAHTASMTPGAPRPSGQCHCCPPIRRAITLCAGCMANCMSAVATSVSSSWLPAFANKRLSSKASTRRSMASPSPSTRTNRVTSCCCVTRPGHTATQYLALSSVWLSTVDCAVPRKRSTSCHAWCLA